MNPLKSGILRAAGAGRGAEGRESASAGSEERGIGEGCLRGVSSTRATTENRMFKREGHVL